MSVLLDALKKAEEENKAHVSSTGLSGEEALDFSEDSLDLPKSLDDSMVQNRFFKVNQDVTLPQNSETQSKQFWVLLGFAGLIFLVVALFFGQKKHAENKVSLDALDSSTPSVQAPKEKSLGLNALEYQNTKTAVHVTKQDAGSVQNTGAHSSEVTQSKINQPTLKEEHLAELDNKPIPTRIHEAKTSVEKTHAPPKGYAHHVSTQNNVTNKPKKLNKLSTKKAKKTKNTPTNLTQNTAKKSLTIKREKTLTTLVNEGYALYQKGEYGTSLSKYAQAYRQSPVNQDALLGMVATHTKLGQPDLANVYRQKLKMLGLTADRDRKIKTDSPKVSSDRSKIPPTPNLLLAQLKKTPNDAQLNFSIATLFAKKGDWEKAQNYYFKAHQFAPNNPNYAFNLAVSLEHLGHSKTALSFYKKTKNLMQVSPSSVNPMIVAKRLDVLSQHFELGSVN